MDGLKACDSFECTYHDPMSENPRMSVTGGQGLAAELSLTRPLPRSLEPAYQVTGIVE